MTSYRQVHNAICPREGCRLLFMAALVAFAGCWLEKRNAMDFTTLTYSVGGFPETTQILTIKANGQARYVSHTNEHFLDRPEIGVYETILDRNAFRSLKDIFDQGPLAQLPDHTGKIPKGIATKMITVVTPTAEIVKKVSHADPIDPRLQKILDHLDGLALEIMKYPRAVLQVEIASPELSPPGNLLVNFKLSNVGSEELWFRSPQDIVRLKDGWVRIEIWPAVPEPGSMWSEQKVFVEPTSVEPVSVAGVQSGNVIFLLRPKETMQFKLKGLFNGKSGSKYVARVDYGNVQDKIENKAPIVGEVWTKTTEFAFP